MGAQGSKQARRDKWAGGAGSGLAKKMMIAIVEDDQEFQAIVEDWLSSSEFSCTVFKSGRELIRSLRDDNFDMFVLDWNLPDLSGIRVLEWIRNHLGQKIPVLMLTGRRSEMDVSLAMYDGANDYMKKPFDPR